MTWSCHSWGSFLRGTAMALLLSSSSPSSASTLRSLSLDEWREVAKVASSRELATWLRDDDLHWNASAAGEALIERVRDPQQAVEVARELFPLLDVADPQAREVAAGLLQIACTTSGGELVPTERLLAISIESAVSYSGSVGWTLIPGELDAPDAVEFLSQHAALAAPLLLERLRAAAKDPHAERTRFVSAYLLSFSPGSAPIAEVAAPLVEGLRSNWISYDALMGLVALGRLGPAAGGEVRTALAASDDEQQRACLRMLLSTWDYPAEAPMRSEALVEVQRVRLTWKVQDPLAEWTFAHQRWR